MATRTIFEDGNNNEMDCYLNDKGQVYISIGQKDDNNYGGFITLDKEDVKKLQDILSECEKNMTD